MQDEQAKRHWQFSLRDVLLIMLIVGLTVGWLVDHRRLVAELGRQQQPHYRVWVGGGSAGRVQAFVPTPSVFEPTLDAAASDYAPLKPDERITDPPPRTPEL
jgi:hypothetical protein